MRKGEGTFYFSKFGFYPFQKHIKMIDRHACLVVSIYQQLLPVACCLNPGICHEGGFDSKKLLDEQKTIYMQASLETNCIEVENILFDQLNSLFKLSIFLNCWLNTLHS